MNANQPPLPAMGNLFSPLPEPKVGEVFDELLRVGGTRIERIVSSDRPEPELYDQDGDEWVCLLQGVAELEVRGESVTLHGGDYLHLPARTPHRVLVTSRDPVCVWLAVHLPADPEPTSGVRESRPGSEG